MTTYYCAEMPAGNAYCKADEKFEAKTLTQAKRHATRRQVFQGTALVLGTAVDETGIIPRASVVAYKEGGKWYNYEYDPIFDFTKINGQEI